VTWAEYYENTYEWSDREKVRRLTSLESFGAVGEVYDAATEFSDTALCSKFVDTALGAGIVFDFEQLTELTYHVDRRTANRLVLAYGKPLTEDEVVEIEDQVDARVLSRVGRLDGGNDDDDDEDVRESVLDRSRMRPATEEDVKGLMEAMKQVQERFDATSLGQSSRNMDDRSGRPGCLGFLGAAIIGLLAGHSKDNRCTGGGAMGGGIGVDRPDVFGRDYTGIFDSESARDEYYRRMRQERYESGEARDEFELIE
jgi:hypothetical protein